MVMRSLVLLASLAHAGAVRGGASATANPIRKVVNMLQAMQKKISEEAKVDEELFEKFMCYCKNGEKSLGEAIAAAENKIPQVSASLDEAVALKEQLTEQLASHKADRAEAKDAVAKATALREKEANQYSQESSDAKTNIAALGKAIGALEKGMGSFLQTSSAAALRRLTVSMDLSNTQRDILVNFLSETNGADYAPQSGQITGILNGMKDTLEKTLAGIEADEKQAIADFEALMAAKEKEIRSNSEAIESKLQRHGQTGLEIEALKEDLDDTQKSLAEDKKFLANLDSNCAAKKAEWETIQKTRSDELLALAETIKILNDDDALELFKKTLPSPSLLQTRASSREVRRQAASVLAAARARKGSDPRLDLLVLALSGKKGTFDKVLNMIDEMVKLLVEEQKADDKKKAYCEAELDKNEDMHKELELGISDLSKAITEAEDTIATLTEEVTTLEQGIKDLDKQVAEATETRKEENAENTQTLQNDQAAKEVLTLATNRLHQFYNPKLYKPKSPEEMSREEEIVKNFGSFVQLSTRSARGKAPGPPPDAFKGYSKKGQESTGVLEMMNMLMTDLEKEMEEVKVEEKEAQSEYEQLMADSGAKRAADTKSIEEKESAKADLEAESQKMASEKKSKLREAMATAETIGDLHMECDWLVQNFEARKEARAGESDALKSAKAVLSGADYSLVQTSVSASGEVRRVR